MRSAKQREIDSRVHSERVALYHALMESLGVLGSEGSNGGRNGTGDLFAVEKALFLRGSVAVNNEYRALLRPLSDPGADEKSSGAKSQSSSSRCVGTAASLPMGWRARIGWIWCVSRLVKLLLNETEIARRHISPVLARLLRPTASRPADDTASIDFLVTSAAFSFLQCRLVICGRLLIGRIDANGNAISLRGNLAVNRSRCLLNTDDPVDRLLR